MTAASSPPAEGAALPALTSLAPSVRRYYGVLFWGYVVLALVIFTFVVPPFQKNDEPLHYYRTVSITNLDFVCTHTEDGRYYSPIKRKYFDLPYVLGADAIWRSLQAKFSPRLLTTDFSDPKYAENTPAFDICNLSVPGYIPNALGLLLGKPFTSPVPGFYFGRIAGVLFFLGCTFAALRIVPARYQLALYFYAALPMVLHQVSSFSYDAVQLSLFPLLFAYLTRFLLYRERIRTRELLLFVATIWLVLSIKSFAYYGVLLLYFVIPMERIAATRWAYARVTAGFLAITALTIGPLEAVYLSRSGLVNPAGGAIAPRQQLRFVIDRPFDFLAACYRTVQAFGETLVRQAVGVFGWVGFEVNFVVIYGVVAAAGLLTYLMARGDRRELALPGLVVLWGAVLVTVVSLFFSLYAAWSPVGAPRVLGLQGRYFLGLTPFAMLAVSQTAATVRFDRLVKLVTVVVLAGLLVSMFIAVYHRYY